MANKIDIEIVDRLSDENLFNIIHEVSKGATPRRILDALKDVCFDNMKKCLESNDFSMHETWKDYYLKLIQLLFK